MDRANPRGRWTSTPATSRFIYFFEDPTSDPWLQAQISDSCLSFRPAGLAPDWYQQLADASEICIVHYDTLAPHLDDFFRLDRRANLTVVLGCRRWEDEARLLAAGAWCLSNAPKPAELLLWLRNNVPRIASGVSTARPDMPAPIWLQPNLRLLQIGSTEVPLQPREASLLRLLVEAGDAGCKPKSLCEHLVGEHSRRCRAVLVQHVHSLRAKLGHLGHYIVYSRTKGYQCLLPIELREELFPS